MHRRLFTVTQVIAIARHGIYLFPGLTPEGSEQFRIGDNVLLKRPDGSELHVRIDALELPSPNPEHRVIVGLRTLSKDDIPLQTEVWSLDDAHGEA